MTIRASAFTSTNLCVPIPQAALAACLVALRQSGEISCDGACNNLARHVFGQCTTADRSEGDCKALADDTCHHCVAAQCQRLPEPTCEERRQTDAEALFDSCVTAGGTKIDCSLRAHESFNTCVTTK